MGYLLKENASSDLLKCLYSVSKGTYYVSPSLSGHLINREKRAQTLRTEYPGMESLTAMEKRVLKMIAENKTSKEIAGEPANDKPADQDGRRDQ